jgi:hypothetical protein
MKLFELAWVWHEDYVPHLFVHEEKTESQFESDVKTLFKEYGDAYLAQETSWAGASSWLDFIATKLPELGYVRVQPFQVSVFGAFIIENKEHDQDDRDFAKEFIGDELLMKAVKHNDKIRAAQN